MLRVTRLATGVLIQLLMMNLVAVEILRMAAVSLV
jgi:hypothetical protein